MSKIIKSLIVRVTRSGWHLPFYGVAVVSSILCISATLNKRKYDMDDEVLMDLVTEAFPIVVFTKQLENKKRRLMEIMECEITPDGKRHFNSLFRYEITENRVEGDKFIINGTHKKVCGISESLKKRFLENGMPREVLNKITGGGASVC